MEEEREEDKKKTLNPEHYISVMEADLEQENKFEDEEVFSGRVNHSCSHSPIEKYQNQRINSEIHHLAKINKHRFPRTTSLDFNSQSATILSPQFSRRGTTNLTPNYQKGWSSERVPLHMNKRKLIPSKWEDAERWIGSSERVPSYHLRQPKSKNGPYGPHSTTVPCFDSGRVVNMASNSPLLAGVLVGNPQCYGSARGSNGSYVSENVESYTVQQSAAASGWSDLSSESNTQGENLDSKEGSMMCSPRVMLKDMATQMSHSESAHSSPKERLVSVDPIVDMGAHFSKLEIRDVEVDGQFTVTRRQKKHTTSDRCLRNIIEWKNTTEEDTSSYQDTDPSKYLSIRDDIDEAKIGAWTNLQEVKAGEAIGKLELKSGKERPSSMDKILNKLRSTQKKAGDKRSAVRSCKSNPNRRTNKKASLVSTSGHLSFLKGCFACHAS